MIRARGLTLVELLMAVTIFALLTVGLSAHLRGAAVAWRRTIHETEALQRLRVAVEQLERDLANATLFDGGGQWTPAPVFERERLAWYARRPGLRENDPASLRYVDYHLDASSGTLMRTTLPVQMAHAALSTEPDALLRGVTSMSVRYALAQPSADGSGAVQWVDQWTQEGRLPGLVEVEWQVEDEAGARRRIRRTIHVPSGTLQQVESPG